MSALGKLALLGIPVAGLAAGLGSAAASTAKGVLQGSRRTKQKRKDSESTYGGGEGPGEVGGWPGTRKKRIMFEQSQQLDESLSLGKLTAKAIQTSRGVASRAAGAADKLAVPALIGMAAYDALTPDQKAQADMRVGESPTQKAARKKRERQERIDRMKASGAVYDADNIAGKQKMNEKRMFIRPAAAIGGALLAKKLLGPKKKEDGSEAGNAARAAVRGAIAAGGAIAGWKVGKAIKASMKDDEKKPEEKKKDKPKPPPIAAGRTSGGLSLIKQQ